MSTPENPQSWLEKIAQALLREPKDLAELITLLRHANKRHLIDNDALDMIEGVLSVTEKQVRDVMVPRPNMVIIQGSQSPHECLSQITQSGHSRFPVVSDEDKDKITGILLAKDLLKVINDDSKKNLQVQRLARPVTFVPESKRLDILLKEFRENRKHMAVVIDEYGHTAGLVTIEDLLEEIVGEIVDEHDTQDQSPFIAQQDEQTYIIKAATPIEEFNEYFHTDIAHEDFDTIGGLLLKHFSYVPKKGENATIAEFQFSILRADARHIKTVQLIKPKED